MASFLLKLGCKSISFGVPNLEEGSYHVCPKAAAGPKLFRSLTLYGSK